MSNYTFTFKKDDILAEFTTTDKAVIEKQFNIWTGHASVYAQKMKNMAQQIAKEETMPAPIEVVKVEEPQPEREQAPKIILEEPPMTETANFTEIIEPEQKIEPSEQIIEVKQEQIIEITPEKIEPTEQAEKTGQKEEVFDKASSLLKTINSIQTPDKEVAQEVVDFEVVLEKSIENPTFEPNSNKDQKFLELVESKNTTDKFHYLMITAYYLSEVEKLERFSLKQLNAKLMQNLSTLIDHTVLQDALTQQFIDVVPDLTGMSDVCEYKLTEKGEEFFSQI